MNSAGSKTVETMKYIFYHSVQIYYLEALLDILSRKDNTPSVFNITFWNCGGSHYALVWPKTTIKILQKKGYVRDGFGGQVVSHGGVCDRKGRNQRCGHIHRGGDQVGLSIRGHQVQIQRRQGLVYIKSGIYRNMIVTNRYVPYMGGGCTHVGCVVGMNHILPNTTQQRILCQTSR